MEDLDFLTQTFLGVDLAFRGSIRALSHSKELQSIGIKALLFVGASAWTTYLTINITMLPIRLAYRIATLFLHSYNPNPPSPSRAQRDGAGWARGGGEVTDVSCCLLGRCYESSTAWSTNHYKDLKYP